jgi:hypothetical protein
MFPKTMVHCRRSLRSGRREGGRYADVSLTLRFFGDDPLKDPKKEKFEARRLEIGYVEAPANVTIKMKDNRIFSGERQYSIGSFQEPIPLDRIEALYMKFTERVVDPEQAEKTSEMIMCLEKLKDVQELMDILTYRHRMCTG